MTKLFFPCDTSSHRGVSRGAVHAIILIATSALPMLTSAQNTLNNAAQAKTWPTRTVRILVGFPGGSSPDLTARTLAEPLSQALGRPVIVENRPGASGNIAGRPE